MKQKFLLCVDNQGYEASLELRKLYETIPDKEAERHNTHRFGQPQIRVYSFQRTAKKLYLEPESAGSAEGSPSTRRGSGCVTWVLQRQTGCSAPSE